MKPVGKPDAGNPHVRFDERGRETGRRFNSHTRARPRLYRPRLVDLFVKWPIARCIPRMQVQLKLTLLRFEVFQNTSIIAR